MTEKSTPAVRTITVRILEPLQGVRCRTPAADFTGPCTNLASGSDGLCRWCRERRP